MFYVVFKGTVCFSIMKPIFAQRPTHQQSNEDKNQRSKKLCVKLIGSSRSHSGSNPGILPNIVHEV